MMDRRDVLKALLAGGAVAACTTVPKAPLTEEEFEVLALCACPDVRQNPSFDRDGGVHALMEEMRTQGLLHRHDNVYCRAADGNIVNTCYVATPYGKSVLRTECERAS